MPDSVPRTNSDDEDIELLDAPPVDEENEKSELEQNKKTSDEDEYDEFGSDLDEEAMNEIPLKAEPPSSPPKSTFSKIPPVKAESKLDKMFADDDDDDAFDDDEWNGKPVVDSKALLQGMSPSDPEVMMAFYQRLFPFKPLFQWLNHSPVPSKSFAHREFAYDLFSGGYVRYNSFTTADLFRKDVIRFNPTRFEVGPIYSANPRDRKQLPKSAFHPIEKELVFDIDMTDYDEIRTCCSGANICHKCWSWVTMAIKILDAGLREDFGYKHIMWVYSGRRGAHAWVCDKRARMLDDQARKAITSYFEVVKGGTQSGKKVNVKRPLHPHLARSLNILKDDFQSRILEDQDPWRTPEGAQMLLGLLPDRALNEALRKKWDSNPNRSSVQKWEDIDALAKSGVSSTLDSKQLLAAKQDIIIEYMYPRLDAKVSKQMGHLLKSPFCVHPKTGRVCVPIEATKADQFDPFTVPTVMELLQEVNDWDGKKKEEKKGKREIEGAEEEMEEEVKIEVKIPDYDKTSLKPYIDGFKIFIAKMIKDEAAIKREASSANGDSMEF